MDTNFRKFSVISCVATIALMGCSMDKLPMKAPSASDYVDTPVGISADSLVSCAESAVMQLERGDDRWDKRVTLKDAQAGIIETGNFQEENESGFRVRVAFAPEKNRADIALKGAGAYFVDLGADEAMAEFKKAISKCLSNKA